MQRQPTTTACGSDPGHHSLKRALTISFCLIVLLSCVTVAGLGIYFGARRMREDSFRQLETLRDTKLRATSVWFGERQAGLRVCGMPGIVELCAQHEQGRPFAAELNRATLMRIKTAFGYEAVLVADPKTGLPLVSTDPGDTKRRHLLERHFKTVLNTKQVLITDVLLDEVDNRPETMVAAPVLSPADNRVIGIVVFAIDAAKQLYPLLTDVKRLGETDETVLVSKDGIVQTPLRLRPDACLNLIVATEAAKRGAAGSTGRVQENDYRGIPVMAAYGHFPETHWGIVVKQDMEEINAPVLATVRTMSFVSIGAIVVVIAVGLLRAQLINEGLKSLNQRLAEQSQELSSQAEQLKVQQMTIHEADRLKSEFLSDLSHELRTPLNNVMALSQLMVARGVGRIPEEDLENLRIIERNGRQLAGIINDNLDPSKSEARRV